MVACRRSLSLDARLVPPNGGSWRWHFSLSVSLVKMGKENLCVSRFNFYQLRAKLIQASDPSCKASGLEMRAVYDVSTYTIIESQGDTKKMAKKG